MMKSKRIAATLMACILSAGMLSGCGESSTKDNGSTDAENEVTGTTVDKDENGETTLTVALALEPSSLMPTAAGSKENYMVMNCMAETLFKWDPETGEINPNLAEFEWVDDQHFRVTLKEGIYFQNGEELKADDVLYTFEVGSQYSAGNYEAFNLENTVVEDDYNLLFETKNVLVQAPERFVQETYEIFSKKTLESMGGADSTALYPTEGYGTGKYIFNEWVSGQYILLDKNENYWNKDDMPYYDHIKFVFVNDAASRAMAVESGDANVGSDLPVSQASIYQDNASVAVHYMDTMQCGTVFMNTSRGPLQDERVREAIWNLIDVNALNQLVADGRGAICQTTISPYSIVYDPVDDPTRTVNVEKAKELLKEAGYEDGFTLEMTNMATQQAQGEIIQENLRQAGINVNITINETPTHFKNLREGNFDLTISNLSPMYYTENLRLVDGRIDSSVVWGGALYKDENFYPLLDRAYSAFDMDERIAAYKDCQDYMKEHYVVIGTHTTVKLELTSAGLSAPGLTALGYADYTEVHPE